MTQRGRKAGWKLIELWAIRAETRLDFDLFVLVHTEPGVWASGCGHWVKGKNMAQGREQAGRTRAKGQALPEETFQNFRPCGWSICQKVGHPQREGGRKTGGAAG